MHSTPDRLYVLPCDHRDILRGLWDTYRSPEFADSDSFAMFAKEVVIEGLLLAVDRGVPVRWAALLMDDELGSAALSTARQAGVTRILPVDTGEVGPFTLQYPDDLDGHVARVDPEFAACLIAYNPESEDAGDQLDRTRALASWQASSDRAFLLELQVLPREEDLASDAGVAWEESRRPMLIARAIRDLRGVGFEPQVWKLQDAGTSDGYSTVLQAVTEGGRDSARVVILGAGAHEEMVDAWLQQAAGYTSCIGFAIGRSVWGAPIEALARGDLDRNSAARRISDQYTHFVDTYSQSRDRMTV